MNKLLRNLTPFRQHVLLLFNNAEYKKIGQDLSLGQLYKIQNEIKILYKQRLGLHFLWQCL